MIVLITGASSGFGAAMARKFVAGGHRVIAAARRSEKLASLQQELGTALLALTMDVTDKSSITQGLTALPADWQPIDVLINNAGLALGVAPAQQSSLADWETMIATNVTGLVTLTHLLLPSMVARNSGMIINIGSVAGSTAYPGGNVYGATKAFVGQFTKNLRADFAGTGIRVTDIAPGLCGGSEFSQVRLHGDEAAAAKIYEGTQPLTSEDIADTAYWIATLPAHVNINYIEMMPTCQGFGALNIQRQTPA